MSNTYGKVGERGRIRVLVDRPIDRIDVGIRVRDQHSRRRIRTSCQKLVLNFIIT